MAERAVCLMLVPGFADWEPAHALAELWRHGGYRTEAALRQGTRRPCAIED